MTQVKRILWPWTINTGKSRRKSLGLKLLMYKGGLKNLSFWREILKAPDYVLDRIQCGYKLPLLYLPDSFNKGNHSSTRAHEKFVTKSINQLLANRCIKKVDQRPHICSPMSVVENADKKLCLVLNLRYLNQFLQKEFMYEDLRVALLMFTREDFLLSSTLSQGTTT